MAMMEEIACHAPCGRDAVRYGLRQVADTLSGSRPEKATPIALSSQRRETGAGEGIRTLDPDLGKVVLYP
jgi:hypothetical protein